MKNKVVLMALSIIGIALTLSPFVFMIGTSIIGSIQESHFRMDYLLPAEMAYLVLSGGIILTVVAWIKHRLFRWFLVGMTVIVVSLLLAMTIPLLAGFANADVPAEGFWFIVTLVFLALYGLSGVFVGVLGFTLFRRS